MTRWAMIADLERCVGCQTCTAACKHANATSPAVQWRKVLDIESGEYPDVRRTFVPVGCQHCADPPCMHVCPSTATGQREDGIVTIDYDLCIGCAYCAVACPYQARFKVDKPVFAYGGAGKMSNEVEREDPARLGVAQKCTFCSQKVDYGLANGLTPGIDPDATPACVNSCIAGALHFGDADDEHGHIADLLKTHETFRMHEEVGTDPGFHYIWARKDESASDEGDEDDIEDVPMVALSGSSDHVGGVAPWLQRHWDWRAAGNFIGGGSGTGLIIASALAAYSGGSLWPILLIGLGFVGLGLFCVWLETGRPFRAPLNVLFNPQTSWMTREAMAGMALFPIAAAAAWFDRFEIGIAAGVAAAAFLYCQGRILEQAKGIPCWRTPAIIPLIMTTGLAEGAGFAVMLSPPEGAHELWSFTYIATGLMIAFVFMRRAAWRKYRAELGNDAPTGTLKALAEVNPVLFWAGYIVPLVLVAVSALRPEQTGWALPLAGIMAVTAGWILKYTIIVKASYNQGFAIRRTPERGGEGSGSGVKPGWGLGD